MTQRNVTTQAEFVAVGVEVATLRPITGSTAKAKAPRVVRACVECDVHGRVVENVKVGEPA